MSSSGLPDTAPLTRAQSLPLSAKRSHLGTALRYSSPQDWLVFIYLIVLNLVLLPRFGEPGYARSALQMGSLLVFFVLVMFPVRAGLWRDGWLAPLGYRVAIQGTVQTSYFFFLTFLPLVNPRTLDRELFALDLRLFGFEPSLALERFITPFASEWFAFFYFWYFLVLAVHSLPIVLCERRERLLCEFTLGMIIVFCVGHVCYMAVPGFGPVKELEGMWTRQLPSGFWVNTVLETVKSGGAQKDIFPSLHTAAPTFITLFSFRNRQSRPFTYTWPVVAFFAVNIVIATMFLRWHWLIDVLAGLALAVLSFALSIRVTRWDLARRQAHELGPSWPTFRLIRTIPSPQSEQQFT